MNFFILVICFLTLLVALLIPPYSLGFNQSTLNALSYCLRIIARSLETILRKLNQVILFLRRMRIKRITGILCAVAEIKYSDNLDDDITNYLSDVISGKRKFKVDKAVLKRWGLEKLFLIQLSTIISRISDTSLIRNWGQDKDIVRDVPGPVRRYAWGCECLEKGELIGLENSSEIDFYFWPRGGNNSKSDIFIGFPDISVPEPPASFDVSIVEKTVDFDVVFKENKITLYSSKSSKASASLRPRSLGEAKLGLEFNIGPPKYKEHRVGTRDFIFHVGQSALGLIFTRPAYATIKILLILITIIGTIASVVGLVYSYLGR